MGAVHCIHGPNIVFVAIFPRFPMFRKVFASFWCTGGGGKPHIAQLITA